MGLNSSISYRFQGDAEWLVPDHTESHWAKSPSGCTVRESCPQSTCGRTFPSRPPRCGSWERRPPGGRATNVQVFVQGACSGDSVRPSP